MMRNISLAASFFLCLASVNLQSAIANPAGDKFLKTAMDVENVDYCRNCHAIQHGALKAPAMEWKKGVHAEAMKNCNICHGGNPNINSKTEAKAPGSGFIGKPSKNEVIEMCARGGCHATANEQFKRGSHYSSVMRLGSPNCVDCHGSHKIYPSSLAIINDKTCSGCHSVDYSRKILKSLKEIDSGFQEISSNIDFLKTKYVDVAELTKRFETAQHLFNQLVHIFSELEISTTKRIIELEIQNLKIETNSRVAMAKRLDFLYYIMIGIGLSIMALTLAYTIYMYSKRK